MRIEGVAWLPGVAGVVAVSLLGAGLGAGIVVAFAAAAALGCTLAASRHARRRAPAAAPPPAVAALQRALARRNEHLARTVHELRTPLCTVAAALDLLRGEGGAPRRDTDELLACAVLATDHLTHLVDDVLDDAALTAGRLRLTLGSHRAATLLGDCARLLRLHAERSGRQIELGAVDADLAVRTDPRRFQQIVTNLVGNALKVAPVGTPVRIEVQPDPQRIRFVVVDRGPGLGPELQGRLFTPFGSGAHGAGTGLGLHVSMRLVQQMGGRIGHAETAQGTTFWFELPRAIARRPAAEPPPPRTTGRTRGAVPALAGSR
ncbi:MAG: HAMP domain-containing histidine kinase [Planctomycetes bacterium]|nr:HAMP domain-containing histidine kinase [Planctomycetota bacterium]